MNYYSETVKKKKLKYDLVAFTARSRRITQRFLPLQIIILNTIILQKSTDTQYGHFRGYTKKK